jgi:hypothetical protein
MHKQIRYESVRRLGVLAVELHGLTMRELRPLAVTPRDQKQGSLQVYRIYCSGIYVKTIRFT